MFSVRCSLKEKTPASQTGRLLVTLRRRLSMVLPQMAKLQPSKRVMAHMIKPTVMATVLPERMEPSQMMPS